MSSVRQRLAYVGLTVGHRSTNFLAAVVAVRALGAEDVGRLTLIWIASVLMGSALSAGLDWRITLDATDHKTNEALRVISRGRLSIGALCALAISISVLTAWDVEWAVVALGYCSVSAFDVTRSGMFGRALGLGDLCPINIMLFVGSLGRLAAVFIALAASPEGLVVTLSLLLATSAGVELYCAWAAVGKRKPRGTQQAISLCKLLQESRMLILLAVTIVVYSRVDALLVGGLLSLDELGAFGLWLRCIEPLLLVLGTIQPILLRATRLGQKTNLFLVSGTSVAASVPVALVGPDLVAHIFSFDASDLQFIRLMPVYAAFAALSTVYVVRFMEACKHSELLKILFQILAFKTMLNLVLISALGTWGAVLATIVAEIILVGLLSVKRNRSGVA